jgi:Uma2 family endonuclease
MGMPAVQDEWTVERALALPDDGNRYEVLDGELFVVPARPEGKPKGWTDVKSLLLAIEVLSPSTARADRHRKRLIYQDQRVPEYWVVDLDARLVERWRPDDARAELMAERLEWQPRADLEPMRIDLPAFFDEVLGR